MRIDAVTLNLKAGGAERILSLLANAWCELGCDVRILPLQAVDKPFFSLSPEVRVQPVTRSAGSGGLAGAIPLVLRLRRTLVSGRPDVCVSFLDIPNLLTIAATRVSRIPVVISERGNPNHTELAPRMRLWRGRLYPRADAVVVQTRSVADLYSRQFEVRDRRIHTIPNPLAPEFDRPAVGADRRSSTVVAAGRLVPMKGFHELVRAFSIAVDSSPEWDLCILGDGPERSSLLNLAAQLGIGPRLRLPGMVPDVTSYLRSAAVFALTSHHEGFPNVLLEAMASGCAVLATDCDFGPRDMISHGHTGLLVPPGDPDLLAELLRLLIQDPGLRSELGRRAASVRETHRLKQVAQQWLGLFRMLASRDGDVPTRSSCHGGRG